MHYKNGRVAKNGDIVVMFPTPNGTPIVGMLHDAIAGNDACNGRLAEITQNDHYANLAECLHVDDVKLAITQVPNVMKNGK